MRMLSKPVVLKCLFSMCMAKVRRCGKLRRALVKSTVKSGQLKSRYE